MVGPPTLLRWLASVAGGLSMAAACGLLGHGLSGRATDVRLGSPQLGGAASDHALRGGGGPRGTDVPCMPSQDRGVRNPDGRTSESGRGPSQAGDARAGA